MCRLGFIDKPRLDLFSVAGALEFHRARLLYEDYVAEETVKLRIKRTSAMVLRYSQDQQVVQRFVDANVAYLSYVHCVAENLDKGVDVTEDKYVDAKANYLRITGYDMSSPAFHSKLDETVARLRGEDISRSEPDVP